MRLRVLFVILSNGLPSGAQSQVVCKNDELNPVPIVGNIKSLKCVTT